MAAGRGTRMGGSLPKQFMEMNGKAILHHTVEKFESALPDVKMVIVLPSNCIGIWKDYCILHNLDLPQTIVEGGFTRFHSVKNALAQIPDHAIVAVHDGVRPLVSVGLIRKMFAEADASEASGLIPVLPMVDTLKALEKDSEGVLHTIPDKVVDRSRVYAAQTPQIFKSEIIKKAYDVPYRESFTDDASVVENYGGKLEFCEGERFNIKITRPEDLKLAKTLMSL